MPPGVYESAVTAALRQRNLAVERERVAGKGCAQAECVVDLVRVTGGDAFSDVLDRGLVVLPRLFRAPLR